MAQYKACVLLTDVKWTVTTADAPYAVTQNFAHPHFIPAFVSRFASAFALVSIGTGLMAVHATPLVLELHGEYRVALVFGIFTTVTGISGLVAPPITGKVS